MIFKCLVQWRIGHVLEVGDQFAVVWLSCRWRFSYFSLFMWPVMVSVFNPKGLDFTKQGKRKWVVCIFYTGCHPLNITPRTRLVHTWRPRDQHAYGSVRSTCICRCEIKMHMGRLHNTTCNSLNEQQPVPLLLMSLKRHTQLAPCRYNMHYQRQHARGFWGYHSTI